MRDSARAPRRRWVLIVAAHQPGYLPGVSVVSKIAHADAVIWLDDVRFTTPGYVNRNQLPDGTWLTVPVDRRDHRTVIRDVTIAGEGWASSHALALHNRYREAEHFDPGFGVVLRTKLVAAGAPLLELNLVLIDMVFAVLGLVPSQHLQSEIDAERGGTLSTRLARQVRAVGGTAYLAAPSRSLDPDTFAAEGVELLAFDYAGDNPSVVDPLFVSGRLPTAPRQEVSVA